MDWRYGIVQPISNIKKINKNDQMIIMYFYNDLKIPTKCMNLEAEKIGSS